MSFKLIQYEIYFRSDIWLCFSATCVLQTSYRKLHANYYYIK